MGPESLATQLCSANTPLVELLLCEGTDLTILRKVSDLVQPRARFAQVVLEESWLA